MTYSAISAMIFRSLITAPSSKNPLADLYDPRRHMTAASLLIKGRDYGEELVKGAVKNTLTQSKEPKTSTTQKLSGKKSK